MKQVVLEADEKKYKFFMEALKDFDFVKVVKEEVAKKKTIKIMAEGMQDALLASEGKIKSRYAKACLNELSVETIPPFEREVKRLLRKCPSLKKDLLKLVDNLEVTPARGI